MKASGMHVSTGAVALPLLLLLLICPAVLHAAAQSTKPNILVIVADDYGWHNVGWRNPEIKTPNIDALAKAGVTLDRHYTFKYCSPTRSSLLSGRYPLHVNQNNDCNDVASKSGIDLRMTLLPQVMKSVGYKTAMTGKWHLGARSTANLPINRGFDSHLGFLKGGEDHQNQHSGDVVDLWMTNNPAFGRNGTYSTDIYGPEAVRVIMDHDTTDPLFMYLPFQVTHSPYEVPPQYLDPTISDPKRRTFSAMAAIMDEAIGNVTAALKAKQMTDNTVIVFFADNGGVQHGGQAGNNYPLRGQKTSSWEGGVRTTAFFWAGDNFMAGDLRGTVNTGYIHVADWYATLSQLAGADLTKVIDEGVPPRDSMDLLTTLMTPNATNSPRTEIPLAFCYAGSRSDQCIATGWQPNGTKVVPKNAALIAGNLKLVWGEQFGYGSRTGPIFPNGTWTPQPDPGCPSGCLFDIIEDPNETTDIKADNMDMFNTMFARVQEIGLGVYQTNYSDVTDDKCMSPPAAKSFYKGFLGPPCVLQ